MQHARRRPVASLSAGLVLAAVLISLVVPALSDDVGVLGVVVGQVGAAILGVRASRHLPQEERRAWWAIFMTFVFGSIGVFITGLLDSVFMVDVPAYSPVDLVFITGYGFLVYGILHLPTAARRGSARLRILVDAAVGAIAVAVLAWVLVLEGLAGANVAANLWQRIVGLAYPVLDIVAVVVLMAIFIRKRHEVLDVRLILLSVALVFQTIADTSLALTVAGGHLNDAQPIFWLFASAAFFYMLTAIWLDAPHKRIQPAERSPATWPLFIPYGIAGLLFVTLIIRAITSGLGFDVMWLMLGVGAVGVLMSVRQIAAISDLAATVELERRALIASVSHELRTPLTAMIGFLEVLEDPDLDLPPEEAREFLEMVSQQSRYLARIVGDLTMLARVGQEAVELDVDRLPFGTIVSRVRDSLEIDSGEFVVDAPDELVLRVDGERIQQVLLNLLTNAFRYGGDEVHLVTAIDGPDVSLEVHDSGGGVPARHQYTMWERFNRGAHHLNATVPGSGIGLAIVKVLSEAHGGQATYRQSERLGGACFAVELPDAVIYTSAPSKQSSRVHELRDTLAGGETGTDDPLTESPAV